MKKIGVPWIIHIFAFLHAAVAFGCRMSGTEDELLLTILTMTMVLLICIRKGLNIEFTAASIIAVNIIGYILGNAGADILSHIISSTYLIHALATALTTEFLGWSIVAFTRLLKRRGPDSKPVSTNYLKWIVLAMVAVFALRLGMIFLLSSKAFSPGDMMEATSHLLSNSFVITLMLCMNIIYVRFAEHRIKQINTAYQIVILVCFSLCLALLCACLSLPFGNGLSSFPFLPTYIAALIIQVTVYCIVYMVNYAMTTHREMQEERGKANVAQYRYQKLKRQVNPHFLFNSLNALDCLVCEEKTEQASTYIHKLAGVYRYMIKSEEDELVQLKDELTFVGLYVDLLKVRFPEGFEVIVNVPEDAQARFVLPCSIQLLIENATKHNAVSVDNPLIIRVEASDEIVTVSNNIIPKVTKIESTGLGQKYIRQQYIDLSGKSISISRTETEYSVTLPLL